jgi:hypothetical protein
MDAGRWSRPNEEFVLKIRDLIVRESLASGKHTIVDDTNLAPKHEARLRQIAKECNAVFEIQSFTHVPVETCIAQDLKRFASAGEAVIRKMYRDYLAPPVPKIEWDPKLPSCVICDIDGTVALMNGRGPFEEDKVDTDLPNVPVVGLVQNLMIECMRVVIFVSGRHEKSREKTEKWLVENNLGYEGKICLFMRPDGDDRQDSIIKTEIFEREFRGKFNVEYVIDDRKRVCEGWRALGLTVLQVAEGDF